MIYISHRGNQSGPERENAPDYIEEAIAAGYQAEIDVRLIGGLWFLGHDEPRYQVTESFLQNDKLWCHAKNHEAFFQMRKNPRIHCFWHQQDDYIVTSRGYLWAYPGMPVNGPRVIACMPESAQHPIDLTAAQGICSDYIRRYEAAVE